MRASLQWLSELLPGAELGTRDLAKLAHELDMTGTAVESYSSTADALDNVVIGQITKKEKHPNADTLWVTHVDVGQSEDLQIVCGAQNFAEKDKVVVALVGAVLPGDFKIKKSKLRGVTSMGMNCSAKELGLGQDHEGIMVLPQDAPIGANFAQWSGSADVIFDFEITPNRSDCLSMVGLAREIGAVTKTSPVDPVEFELKEAADTNINSLVRISVKEDAETPRYCGRVIRKVKVGPSPDWLARKVEASGARSINNVVDATNYILFEMGQPLHAFDLGKLAKDEAGVADVIIRKAKEGEEIFTLDDQKRTLTARDTLITDSKGGICIAGVMGGANSEVDENTTEIFLESAMFDHSSISRTSRRMGLISEASLRFERIVDRTRTLEILDRAAALIASVSGGEVVAGSLDIYNEPHSPLKLKLSIDSMEALLGHRIDSKTSKSILRSLGFEILSASEEALEVEVPSFRPDVLREVDLIEEVLRIYGMEEIPAILERGSKSVAGLSPKQKLRALVSCTLRSAGLNEAMSYPYLDRDDLARLKFALDEGDELVELHNPMSIEQSVLRPTLIAGLLRMLSSNLANGVHNVALYEMGAVFKTAEGRKLPEETEMIAGVMSGSWRELQWNDPEIELGFYDAKGIIEELMRILGIVRWDVRAADRSFCQPGRCAEVTLGKRPIGWIGELHPLVGEAFEIEQQAAIFELDLAALIQAARSERSFEVPPKFPAIEIDIALLADKNVEAIDILRRIQNYGRKANLESVSIFDVYTGKGVADDKKSLAFKLVYRSAEKTLSHSDVEKAHAKILERLEKEMKVELRS